MYLECHYSYKGQFLIKDKSYSIYHFDNFFELRCLRLEINHKKELKKMELVYFLFLNLLSLNIKKIYSKYYSFIYSKSQIFCFIETFIMV